MFQTNYAILMPPGCPTLLVHKSGARSISRTKPFEQDDGGELNMLFSKVLIAIASGATIGFGIGHFFVPRAWNWYSYIDVQATELIIAVRAINIFFSLSLVLFGLINILLIFGGKSNRYSILVVLVATSILWSVRVLLQIIYPQGSTNIVLQYGMLFSFILIWLCYLIALYNVMAQSNFGQQSLRPDSGQWPSWVNVCVADRLWFRAQNELIA